MTRDDFFSYIKGLPFCRGLVDYKEKGAVPVSVNEAGDKFYKMNVRYISGNVIEFRDVFYVVLNEGQAGEEVYFLGHEPVAADIGIKTAN